MRRAISGLAALEAHVLRMLLSAMQIEFPHPPQHYGDTHLVRLGAARETHDATRNDGGND